MAWVVPTMMMKPTGEAEHPVLLEIDRGSEQQKYFKKHVRARALFLANGGYKKLFGTNKGGLPMPQQATKSESTACECGHARFDKMI